MVSIPRPEKAASCLILPLPHPQNVPGYPTTPLWLILVAGWKTLKRELPGKGEASAVPNWFIFPGVGHLKRNCDVQPRAKTI